MSASSPISDQSHFDSPIATNGSATVRRRIGWRRFDGKFLVISILAHALIGLVAAYLVVQTIQGRHKLTFQSAPKGANAPSRALEHRVQMKKQHAMSAPPQARRVTTTGLSKIALPDMPAMPSMSAALSPAAVSGMGAAGLAPGALGGGASGMGGGSGAGINFFGVRTGGAGLSGTFYDLKQDRNRKPTNMDFAHYEMVIDRFMKGGFNVGVFSSYYRTDKPIFASQILIPRMNADEGPKAFGLQDIVQPRMWTVLYKGRVVAPETGDFHFVGFADDVLLVQFDGRTVLDGSIRRHGGMLHERKFIYDYASDAAYPARGHYEGEKLALTAGSSHQVQILIGEEPGGFFEASLFIEKEGTEYRKDANGSPILPLFRMSAAKPPIPPDRSAPQFAPDGPVWRAEMERGSSFLDQVR